MFNEKYDENSVRVVSVGGPALPPSANSGSSSAQQQPVVVSAELCGGTHVTNTRHLFPFKILSEGSVASGTRRIEAVCGRAAWDVVVAQSEALGRVAQALHVQPSAVESSAQALTARVRALETELEAAKAQSMHHNVQSFEAVLQLPSAAASGSGSGGKGSARSNKAAAAPAPAPALSAMRVCVHVYGLEVSVKLLRDAAEQWVRNTPKDAKLPPAVHVCVCPFSGRTVADAAPEAVPSTPSSPRCFASAYSRRCGWWWGGVRQTQDAKAVFSLLTSKLGGTGGGSKQRAQGVLTLAGAESARAKLEAALKP
jgi:hypothetical protein